MSGNQMLFGVPDEIRTSRGVLKWPRGKDLYTVSHILGSGKKVQFFRYCTGKLLEGSGGFRRGPEVRKWVHHDPRVQSSFSHAEYSG